MVDYITLTPIGVHKDYNLDSFFQHIDEFKQKPREIVVCVDIDSHLVNIKKRYSHILPNLTVLYNMGPFTESPSFLSRIASAREVLREYFIQNFNNYKWALWIDSDILAPPETPDVLYDVAEKENVLMVSNKYMGRKHHKWSGSGIMFTHRLACTVSRFWVGKLGDKNLSEDYIFLSIINQSNFWIEKYTGRKNRAVGEFVTVTHKYTKDK